MLKVSSNKAIAGFAPCPQCQTPSTVHFPCGGKRANTPYLSCGQCNATIQSSDTKNYIKEHYVPTLKDYAIRYEADVSDEQEQIAANKWTENPAQYDAKMNGIREIESLACAGDVIIEEDSEPKASLAASEPSVTIDNATQEVIEDKEQKEHGNPKASHVSGGIWVLLVVLVISVGGFVAFKRFARQGEKGNE